LEASARSEREAEVGGRQGEGGKCGVGGREWSLLLLRKVEEVRTSKGRESDPGLSSASCDDAEYASISVRFSAEELPKKSVRKMINVDM
jgi:hypothetical protein